MKSYRLNNGRKIFFVWSTGLFATVKLWDTDGAALNEPLPACVAWIVQVPAATNVTVEPLTVQTAGVWLAKLTANPDDAVALRAKGASPSVLLAGLQKVMV